MRQGLGQTRAIITHTRRFIFEDPLAPGGSESVALQIEILIATARRFIVRLASALTPRPRMQPHDDTEFAAGCSG
jgi:hypothetical protein